jgi:tRNA A37 methylthiotransferase MiaB
MRESIPLACSLSAEDQADRRVEFAEVAGRVVSREPTERGVRLRFRGAPGFAEQLADLARREKECCPFFDFRISSIDDEVLLEVGAPPDARPIVEALFALERP